MSAASASFVLYPAIDLRAGRCVRLYQGDYDRETVFGDDPVAQAQRFAEAGAEWIHVVDLDAARSGEPVNRPIIEAIAREVPARVQTGGGVRDEATAAALVDAGVDRVVLGTAAIEDPALVARLASRLPVAVGLDVRGRAVAVRGWLASSGRDVLEVVGTFEPMGVEAFVVTQIARDGTLCGPDLAGLRSVLEATAVPVIASGGVGSAADLRALVDLHVGTRRLAGAVVGRALYEGRLGLTEALAVVSPRSGEDPGSGGR